MRVFKIETRIFTAVLTGLAVLAIATPSLAGTVYKWTTEDGTTAFTDDPKRIPARYKQAAERREMGKLKNYSRLTIAKPTTTEPYVARVGTRLEALRGGQTPAVSTGPPSVAGERPTALNVAIGNGDQLNIPLGGDDSQPLTIEEHRVRLRNTIATQNVRVTRRGDQVLSVTVSPRNQRPINEKNFVGADEIGVRP